MMIAEVEEIAEEMKWGAMVEDEHAVALDAARSDELAPEYDWDYLYH